MKIKTSELTGPALDWAVAKCEGLEIEDIHTARNGAKYIFVWTVCCLTGEREHTTTYNPSTDWAQGGSIMDREDICIRKYHNLNSAAHGTCYAKVCRESGRMVQWSKERDSTGPTKLIAAMRCFVSSKIGDEVDVPEELK